MTEIETILKALPLPPLQEVEIGNDQPGTGLLIVDVVNGFCTVGAGNLAPQATNVQITRMIERINALARAMSEQRRPTFIFRDRHLSDRPEPPYPPHCIAGTGEDELVPKLQWLENDNNATIMPKDCINGVIGGTTPDGSNLLLDWINDNQIERLLVTGICTDICVQQAVQALLSARNHGLTPTLCDIAVVTDACATYDLPATVAAEIGLPASAAHPQDIWHRIGLSMMAQSGAILTESVLLTFS